MSIALNMHAKGNATPSRFAAMLSRRVPSMTGFTTEKHNQPLRIWGNNPRIIGMLKRHEVDLRMSDNVLDKISELINGGNHSIHVICYPKKVDVIIISEDYPTDIKPKRVFKPGDNIFAPSRNKMLNDPVVRASMPLGALSLVEPGNSQKERHPRLDETERALK